VKQVSPNPIQNPGCTYYQAINYVFEECPLFCVNKYCPSP